MLSKIVSYKNNVSTFYFMKKYIIYIGLPFLILFGSCGIYNNYYSVNSLIETGNDKPKNMVQGKVVFTTTYAIENLHATDKYLVVVQRCNDSIFNIIDTKTFQSVACFGQVGHAKNEFIQPPLISYILSGKDDKYYLYAQEMNQMTKIIDLEESVVQGKCIVKEIIKEKVGELGIFYEKFHLSNNNTFVYKSISYQDSREKERKKPEFYIESGNERVMEWDIFPAPIYWDEPNLYESEYTGRVYVSPNQTKAVFMMNMMDVITIFDFEKNKTIGIINHDNHSFDYYDGNVTSKNWEEKMYIHNMTACVGNNRFFVHKDSRLYNDMMHNKGNHKPLVEIYDWEGKRLSSFMVDEAFSKIAYQQSTNTLFAKSLWNNVIYKYQLQK